MHEPDPATPIAETLAVLDDLVRAGKVRYLGSSNFAGWQVADADWTARTAHGTPFISAQNEYSLLERGAEAEVLPACEAHGIGLLPFFPLANGLLTGKYRRDAIPEGSRLSQDRYVGFLARAPWEVVDRLAEFAAARSLSLVDVAIGALAAKPVVGSVIAGATSPEQVRANAAAGAWVPTEDELAELDTLTRRA
jgi:aryl-alcohol dehydrogenase-like predicted oxidoreductase